MPDAADLAQRAHRFGQALLVLRLMKTAVQDPESFSETERSELLSRFDAAFAFLDGEHQRLGRDALSENADES